MSPVSLCTSAGRTFDIYSLQGFQFTESIDEIELKTSAFRGSDKIDDATYTWWWWNELNENGAGYTKIDDEIGSSLRVNRFDQYAFASIKCEMHLSDGSVFEDYVILTAETTVYTASVRFLGGSNVFTANDLFLIAGVEVYKNGNIVEEVGANLYCTDIVELDGDKIKTDINGTFDEDDKMYFVYKEDEKYKSVLCKYIGSEENGERKYSWIRVNDSFTYSYSSTLDLQMSSNILVISKETINKSYSIDFKVYKNDTLLTTTSAMVIDSNDPIISNTAPDNPVIGQLWLDTNTGILMVCTKYETTADFVPEDDTEISTENNSTPVWEQCFNKTGVTTFTSKPTSYKEGDLWILADGEDFNYTTTETVQNEDGTQSKKDVTYSFKAGTMVKSIQASSNFEQTHWVDADAEVAEMKNNISQYFEFNPDTGLKIIGKVDEEANKQFYVNIDSQKMGFHEKTNDGKDVEVVSISNQSAYINNLNVNTGANFDCDVAFNEELKIGGKFVWKIEDGCLSLVVIK